MESSIEGSLIELTTLAQQVNAILKEELKKSSLEYDSNSVGVRIYDVRSVGIQGDKRTYAYPVEIILHQNGKIPEQTEFLSDLSTRITNEIKEINRVTLYLPSETK